MKKQLLITSLLCVAALPMAAQHLAGKPLPPTMGWSSWNTFAAKIDDDIIKGQADAMVATGLDTCGYNYINIDDGFQWDRAKDGKMQINPVRFPKGLRPLVDYIHSKGLKAGIYSDAGHSTCAYFYGGESHESNCGLLDYDEPDCDYYFNDLDFDFIKVDFCGGTSWQNKEKLDLSAEKRYTDIANAIQKVTGPTGKGVVYNVCRWDFPGTWVCDIADSWRISQDINASWGSVSNIIGQNLYLSAYCTPGHYNDMDMLEVGRGLSEEEDRTHFAMWCMMSSPLLIGCDIRDLAKTEKKKTLSLLSNKELIDINQDALGLQAYVVKKAANGTYVLVKDFGERNGLTRVVALYNPTDNAKNMSFNFADVDLGGKVQVRDVTLKTNRGEAEGKCTMYVPKHGTRVLKLTAEKRLMRTRYEAETAFLSAYQELENNQSKGTAAPATSDACSGGMKVGYLGGNAKNDLQWRDVYVDRTGDYDMTLSIISGENRKINVEVNGTLVKTLNCNSNSWSATKDVKLTIPLNAGQNTVRLYNADAWMPDVDVMTLAPSAALAINDVENNVQAKAEGNTYDLSGRLMPNGTNQRGLLIENGRVVLRK